MTSYSVGTTAIKILARADDRVGYIIQNQGTAPIYVGTDRLVATTGDKLGRKIDPGTIETANEKEDPVLIKMDQYAISTAPQTVWVEEYRRETRIRAL